MSKNTIRQDKTCLNCRHVVQNKYCSNCGQENSDTRKTFHHLFYHFFEDLTHYENAFWKTIKNLLFKPANLTKEYLSGKRLSYLAPVRLYIFISFITFFVLSILPGKKLEDSFLNKEKNEKLMTEIKNSAIKDSVISEDDFEDIDSDSIKSKSGFDYKATYKSDSLSKSDKEIRALLESKKLSDSAKIKLKSIIKEAESTKKIDKADFNFGFATIKELDSAKSKGEINGTTYWFLKKTIEVKDNNTKEEIIEKGIDSAKHNFPKVLIFYMPIFAFFLWIFHNKKRWYYFDHGIFTLHYFSFLLLIFLLISIFKALITHINLNLDFLSKSVSIIGFIWMFYYFFSCSSSILRPIKKNFVYKKCCSILHQYVYHINNYDLFLSLYINHNSLK
jgi:Protein of unknown function (DUF3667)